MSSAGDFAKMVPGFDFLQGLMKNAGSALPSMGQWIAPSLDPAELEKRIEELRTVQFWLEQNARMLATTIQALEVQRMTLSTLKSMNVPTAELAEAFKIRTPATEPAAARPAARRAAPAAKATADAAKGESGAAAGVVDPMQWWGALTRQFTDLAAKTLRETGSEATGAAAGARAPAAAPAPAPAAAKPARRAPRKTAPRRR